MAKEGLVAGVRFFKAAGETGRHTGSLWTSRGVRLARVTFTAETRSGWQEARFAEPVTVHPGQTYTISYHSDNGTYAGTRGSLAATEPLAAARQRTGVYRYGKSRFPDKWNPKNYTYYVDPIFQWWETVTRPNPAPGTTPPAPGTPTPTPPRPTITVTASAAVPSATFSPLPIPPPSPSPSLTLSPSPSVSPTPSPSPSASPSPSPSPSPSRTPTRSATPTRLPLPPSPTRTPPPPAVSPTPDRPA
ncbi:hypothetical protein Acor_68910 [Acrocarpospora corrugata]|uniref:DUF4082 domain-containing protein n=1 Tax=Acrocarpospora corrugata TaxID=35763 RepID=A0A5M3WCK0_9ACTN|nr:hypothetical protein Acor_68910 [Acrocarpospora corrugata]